MIFTGIKIPPIYRTSYNEFYDRINIKKDEKYEYFDKINIKDGRLP